MPVLVPRAHGWLEMILFYNVELIYLFCFCFRRTLHAFYISRGKANKTSYQCILVCLKSGNQHVSTHLKWSCPSSILLWYTGYSTIFIPMHRNCSQTSVTIFIKKFMSLNVSVGKTEKHHYGQMNDLLINTIATPYDACTMAWHSFVCFLRAFPITKCSLACLRPFT